MAERIVVLPKDLIQEIRLSRNECRVRVLDDPSPQELIACIEPDSRKTVIYCVGRFGTYGCPLRTTDEKYLIYQPLSVLSKNRLRLKRN